MIFSTTSTYVRIGKNMILTHITGICSSLNFMRNLIRRVEWFKRTSLSHPNAVFKKFHCLKKSNFKNIHLFDYHYDLQVKICQILFYNS